MRLDIKIFRVTTLFGNDFMSILSAAEGASASEMEALLKKNFYPFPPRFKVFWPSQVSLQSKISVGMEAIAWVLTEAKIPTAGVVDIDPIDPQDIARIDGAIESELNRMGLSTEFENYEWKSFYEVKGN